MTRDDDIERVLDQWFLEGPTQMPTRFFNATLDRIEDAPKHRLSLGIPRLSRVNRNALLAAALAVTVAVVGVGALFATRDPGVGAMPSPTPTPPAPPTIDPSSIQTRWSSVGPRPNPDSEYPDTSEAFFMLDERSLAVDEFHYPVESAWSLAGPDNRLVLRTLPTNPTALGHWKCEAGQEGTYTVTLSPDGDVMTLSLVSDACATRAGILEGSWNRWPCPNPFSSCLPELAPGQHVANFAPYNDGNGAYGPPPFLSGFSYSVPAGWSVGLGDAPVLMRRNDPGAMWVSAILDVAPHSQKATCPDDPDRDAGRTAAAMADWLTRVPGLVTSTPAPVEIGGYQGFVIDVSVVPGWTTPQCYYDNPIVMTFADPVPVSPDGGVSIRESVERDSHARYILLDVGKGHNLLIEIKAPDEASWDDLVAAAMPIVETFQLIPGSGS